MENENCNWNFHNHIALKMENYARDAMKLRKRPIDTRYDADAIETYSYAEVMIILLRIKTKYRYKEKIDEFIEECKPYIGKSASEIGNEKSKQLMVCFKKIYK